MRALRIAPFALCLTIGISISSEPLNAQAVWIDKFTARGVSVEYLKPFFKDDNIVGATSATFLTGRFPVSNTLRVKPELPLGYVSTSIDNVDASDFVVGNPYVGLEVLGKDGKSTAEIGLRLPAIFDQTPMTAVGLATDFDRFEAFVPETAAITGSFVGRNRSDNVQMDVAGGLTGVIPFNDNDTELFGQYSVQIVLKTQSIGAYAGVAGRILITDGSLSFSERTTHQFGFSVIGYFGNIRPGIMARLALDNPLRDLINAVLGFSLSYEIR